MIPVCGGRERTDVEITVDSLLLLILGHSVHSLMAAHTVNDFRKVFAISCSVYSLTHFEGRGEGGGGVGEKDREREGGGGQTRHSSQRGRAHEREV